MSSELRTLEKEIQFTKVCEDASFWKRLSVGMCYKTIAEVDDVLEIKLQNAKREYTHRRADSDSRIFAAIPGRTTIGPVLQVHITQFLGTLGIEIQIPSSTTLNRNSWVVTWRGRNRYVDELHLRDRGHNPTSSDLLKEDLLKKKVNFVLQSWSNPASRKLMRRSSKF